MYIQAKVAGLTDDEFMKAYRIGKPTFTKLKKEWGMSGRGTWRYPVYLELLEQGITEQEIRLTFNMDQASYSRWKKSLGLTDPREKPMLFTEIKKSFDLLKEGNSWNEISKQIGRDYRTIKRYLKKEGFSIEKR
jgi:hypothetical protein